MFYYVYVLRSIKDNKFYTGYTKTLKLRLALLNNFFDYKIPVLSDLTG